MSLNNHPWLKDNKWLLLQSKIWSVWEIQCLRKETRTNFRNSSLPNPQMASPSLWVNKQRRCRIASKSAKINKLYSRTKSKMWMWVRISNLRTSCLSTINIRTQSHRPKNMRLSKLCPSSIKISNIVAIWWCLIKISQIICRRPTPLQVSNQWWCNSPPRHSKWISFSRWVRCRELHLLLLLFLQMVRVNKELNRKRNHSNPNFMLNRLHPQHCNSSLNLEEWCISNKTSIVSRWLLLADSSHNFSNLNNSRITNNKHSGKEELLLDHLLGLNSNQISSHSRNSLEEVSRLDSQVAIHSSRPQLGVSNRNPLIRAKPLILRDSLVRIRMRSKGKSNGEMDGTQKLICYLRQTKQKFVSSKVFAS